ncbi:MAG: hypothetical protein R3B82_00435 [Sandaracinaceae bacterium]
MEWHVLVFGALTFPSGGLARWRKEPVEAEAFGDWKGELGAGPTGDGAPVREMLRRIAGYEDQTGGLGRVDVEADRTQARFCGYLKDDAFRGLATEVATTFRVAASVGGEGALTILHVDGEEAYRLTVEPGASSCSRWRSRKKLDALEADPLCRAATELYERSCGVVPTSASPAASTWGDDPWPSIALALETPGAAAAHAALRARGGWFELSPMKVVPVEDAFPDQEALLSMVRAGAPASVRALALELVARVDPVRARALATQVLTADAADDLLGVATQILWEAGDEEALRALVAALARPPLDEATGFRGLLAARLVEAPDSAIEAAVQLLAELADRPDTDATALVLVDLALRRQAPIPVDTARRLLARRGLLRERAAAALLMLATPPALEAVAAHVEDPGPLGRQAMQAVFRLDPIGAHERLAPHLEGPSADAVRRHLLGHLAETAATVKKAPALREPRFVELALGALDVPGAITFLGHTKAPGVAATLASLLPRHFEEVCEALQRVGDPSVLPTLRAAASAAPHPHSAKLIARVIRALEKKAGT